MADAFEAKFIVRNGVAVVLTDGAAAAERPRLDAINAQLAAPDEVRPQLAPTTIGANPMCFRSAPYRILVEKHANGDIHFGVSEPRLRKGGRAVVRENKNTFPIDFEHLAEYNRPGGRKVVCVCDMGPGGCTSSLAKSKAALTPSRSKKSKRKSC